MPEDAGRLAGFSIDLSHQARLPPDFGAVYDSVASSIRREFVEFVGSIADQLGDDLDWWLEAPASRHPILSRLFHDCVACVLFEEMLRKGTEIERVIVDTPELYRMVRELAERARRRIPVCYRANGYQRMVAWFREAFSPLRSVVRIFTEWCVIRASRIFTNANPMSSDELILIDTFLLPGFVDADRYYPGLFDLMDGDTRARTRFVPQFHDFPLIQLWRAARWVRAHRDNYLCKEDYVSIRDLAWCMRHYSRVRRLHIGVCPFRGLDMSRFLKAEIRRAKGFRCALRGLINYRFAAGLRRSQTRVAHAIDWYENHPLDRGWNAGFRRHLPDTCTTGYQGFFAALPAMRPTGRECRAGIVPEVIAVMGECFRQDVAEFQPNCDIISAPAFRYRTLAGESMPRFDCCGAMILVALPYDKSAAEFILDLARSVIDELHPQFEFVFKPHPARPLAELTVSGAGGLVPMREVTEALELWYPKVAALITGATSSTVIEAVAYGLPVIVAVPHGRGHEVSIPKVLPRELAAVCHDRSALLGALARIRDFSGQRLVQNRFATNEFRKRCFTPVNRQTVARFLAGRRCGRRAEKGECA